MANVKNCNGGGGTLSSTPVSSENRGGKAAFPKPSRGTSEARGEQESAETSSFRCDCERCRLMRGAVSNQKRGGKAAFTLAEVLITLGIIGVVAAITMPVLISKYKNQVYVNQLKKSVSVFENGIKLIIANEGATDLSETEFGKYLEDDSLSSDALYNKLEPIFKKNFNVVKSYSATEVQKLLPKSGNITNTEDCKKYVGKVSSIAYKVNNTSQCMADPSGFVFYLADGSYVDFEKVIRRPVDNSSDAKVLLAEVSLDTNGLKGPNQNGYDNFTFLLDSMGNLHPAGGIVWAKTAGGEANWKNYYWSSGAGYTCKVKGKNYSGYGTGCSASVIENGWKIDY